MHDLEALKALYAARIGSLQALADSLERRIAERMSIMDHRRHIDHISFRVKEVDSFIEKAAAPDSAGNFYGAPLTEIEDQVGGRIVVYFIHDIDIVIECLVG